MNKQFKPGDRVTYHDCGVTECGIVKSVSHHVESHVFVVYHYDGRPQDYTNFTAALTPVDKLTHGWT